MIVANKIIDKIQSSLARGEVVTSFEFFPAKTEAGVANLIVRAVEMASDLNPTFVTLTWRSAFKDERLWLKIGVALQVYERVDLFVHRRWLRGPLREGGWTYGKEEKGQKR